jgi:hypothetical protein
VDGLRSKSKRVVLFYGTIALINIVDKSLFLFFVRYMLTQPAFVGEFKVTPEVHDER